METHDCARHSACMQDGEDTFFAREALQGRLPKYVELLKFKVHQSFFDDSFLAKASPEPTRKVAHASNDISTTLKPPRWYTLPCRA